ncbi:MAG: uracil-DNA glycosylase family protein [Aestuariivirga sp.]
MTDKLAELLARVRACTLCKDHLPLGPRPVVRLDPNARILIAGQAPGTRVHETGIPFNDPSGDRLRHWLGVTREQFYDEKLFAILPMGFCYPGKGKSGDLPPRPECATHWREELLLHAPNIKLTLAIGQYAIAWHLKDKQKPTLTETVKNWRDYWPEVLPLPHPSPRNNIWLKKNPWFEAEVVPELHRVIATLLMS